MAGLGPAELVLLAAQALRVGSLDYAAAICETWSGSPDAALELTRAAALFGLGIVAIIVRRNVLYVLMGIEMILNAANINFVAFSRFNGGSLDGQMFAIFVIILAAAEAAVALAIVLNVFQLFGSVKPSDVDMLRE